MRFVFFSGRVPPQNELRNTDVLLIRSVTQVTSELLDHAPQLRFLGTGTIGTDHVDTAACEARGVEFCSTPGANAISVGEYVLAATLTLANRKQRCLQGLNALVVGAGHTGSQAGAKLAALGMRVRFIDPNPTLPRDNKEFCDWSALAEADVISFHVPLLKTGANPTFHLLNADRLKLLKSDAILINASRGAVINNSALFELLARHDKNIHVVLDVWEGEPQVMTELVPHVEIATPHIAGHSIEGKLRASYMLYEKVLGKFPALQQTKQWCDIALPPLLKRWPWQTLDSGLEMQKQVLQSISRVSIILNKMIRVFRAQGLTREGFDALRQNYSIRRELSALKIKCRASNANALQAIGFGVELTSEPA